VKPANKGDGVKQKVLLGERKRIKHPRKVVAVASEAETSVRVLKTALEELWGNVLKASKADARPAPTPHLKSPSSPSQTASQHLAPSSKDKDKSASSTISLAKNIISDIKSDIVKASPTSQSKV
jgi:hypothetical protein